MPYNYNVMTSLRGGELIIINALPIISAPSVSNVELFTLNLGQQKLISSIVRVEL